MQRCGGSPTVADFSLDRYPQSSSTEEIAQAYDEAVKDVTKAMKECDKPESKTVPELEKLIEMLGGAIETAETLGVDEKLVPRVFGEL